MAHRYPRLHRSLLTSSLLALVVPGLAAHALSSAVNDGANDPPAAWILALPQGLSAREGRTYSVVRSLSTEEADGQAELIHAATDEALVQLLESCVDKALARFLSPSVARIEIGRVLLGRCLSGVRLTGVDTVWSGRSGDDIVVVRAVDTTSLSALDLTAKAACDCLQLRVDSGSATHLEVMALIELRGAAGATNGDLRSPLLEALTRSFGDGVSLTLDRHWLRAGGLLPEVGLISWCESVKSSLTGAPGSRPAVAPFPTARLSEFDASELAVALGRRMHDGNLLNSLRCRLAADGWTHVVSLLGGESMPVTAIPMPRSGRLSPEAIAQALSTPAVTLLLLSDGDAPLSLATTMGSGFEEARASFNAGTPESMAAALAVLGPTMRQQPDVDSLVLLSAILLACDEPALARPLAKSAYRQSPKHPYAGANLLRAQRALSLTREARLLVSELKTVQTLDDWGRQQVLAAESWLADVPE